MFRTMYKLTKVFSDQPGPRNVTDRLRNKIEKFRQHQPLLNIICNPGIRDRHWEQVNRAIFPRWKLFTCRPVTRIQDKNTRIRETQPFRYPQKYAYCVTLLTPSPAKLTRISAKALYLAKN